MTYREIKRELRKSRQSPTNLHYDEYNRCISASVYLGSYLSLDPCGRYHHILSPNGVTSRCIRFWENMERAADELNAWVESGEGSALDTFLSWTDANDIEPVTLDDGTTLLVAADGTIYYGDPDDLSTASNLYDYLER